MVLRWMKFDIFQMYINFGETGWKKNEIILQFIPGLSVDLLS